MDMMGDNPFKKEHYFNGVVCTVSTNAVLSKFEARVGTQNTIKIVFFFKWVITHHVHFSELFV